MCRPSSIKGLKYGWGSRASDENHYGIWSSKLFGGFAEGINRFRAAFAVPRFSFGIVDPRRSYGAEYGRGDKDCPDRLLFGCEKKLTRGNG
jgi:hypothetical protein